MVWLKLGKKFILVYLVELFVEKRYPALHVSQIRLEIRLDLRPNQPYHSMQRIAVAIASSTDQPIRTQGVKVRDYVLRSDWLGCSVQVATAVHSVIRP